MKLMLSCKEATDLIEKRHQQALSSAENRRLAFHNFICKACKIYAKQSAQIEKLLQQYMQQKSLTPAQIESLKNRIKDRL